MNARTVALCAMLLLASAACAGWSSPSTRSQSARRADLITLEEIEGRQWANAYEMIRELRGNWLHERGTETLHGERGELRVHINSVRLGGLAELNDLPVTGIVSVQYFNPIEATSRWGLGYGKGAIVISTYPH